MKQLIILSLFCVLGCVGGDKTLTAEEIAQLTNHWGQKQSHVFYDVGDSSYNSSCSYDNLVYSWPEYSQSVYPIYRCTLSDGSFYSIARYNNNTEMISYMMVSNPYNGHNMGGVADNVSFNSDCTINVRLYSQKTNYHESNVYIFDLDFDLDVASDGLTATGTVYNNVMETTESVTCEKRYSLAGNELYSW